MQTRTSVQRVGAWAAGALAALATCGAAVGQTCEPGWTEGFPNASGFNAEARAVAIFDDGAGPKVYVGGHFGTPLPLDGGLASGIARWEGDHWAEVGGGIWPVGAGYLGVYWLGVLDDGSGPALYAAGNFHHAGEVSAKGVAKWDGRVWSALGAGLSDTVHAMTVFDDGTGPAIYAAGSFTYSGQTPMRGLAKWDGTVWSQVGGGLGGYGAGYAIGAFDLGDGPRLYVGGEFLLLHPPGKDFWRNIACWDGREWAGFGLGVTNALGPAVMTITAFDHGFGPQLTIGGSFSFAPPGLNPLPRVARWTGMQWVQVGSVLSDWPYHHVNSLVALDGPAGPTLYAGGVFTGAAWLNQVNYMARLVNGDWKTVGGGMAGLTSNANSYVRGLMVAWGAGRSELWAAGAFKVAGDALADRVARWDGLRWNAVEHGRGLTGRGLTACPWDDGGGTKTFVGGEFLGAGDRVCNSIAAWDGDRWRQAGSGLQITTQTQVAPGSANALCAFDDPAGHALYATGWFNRAGGGPCFNVARWDGHHWSAPAGTGLNAVGRALAVFDDGTGPALYVGGDFYQIGPTDIRGIARWNGIAWSAVGAGPAQQTNGNVYALAVHDDSSGPALYAGGQFNSMGGVPAAGVARWNGAVWQPVGTGFATSAAAGHRIRDLAVLKDGGVPTLYAAGDFESVQGLIGRCVARWDGASWHPLPTGVGVVPLGGEIVRLTSFDDGSGSAIYLMGSITVSSTVPNVGVLKFQGGVWSIPGLMVSGASDPAVNDALVWLEGERQTLLLTGDFSHAGPAPSAAVAEWHGCPICYADCDRDANLTAADFGCFQTKFVAGESWADCNQDAALTISDFACFQTKFATGCR